MSPRMHPIAVPSIDACRFERKKEETRKVIISVAMDLFRRQGFDATTMEQISDDVDIARKTLYNHFPVKEAIIVAYVQRSLGEQWAEVAQFVQGLPDINARLIAVLLKQWAWAEANLTKEILEKYYIYRVQTFLQSFKNRNIRTGFADALSHVIKEGQKTGEIKQDIAHDELANHLDWIQTMAVMHWLADPERHPISEEIGRSVSLFLNGVKN